jgi:6-phosphogluconolactonase (cycloisomerase 2 family)
LGGGGEITRLAINSGTGAATIQGVTTLTGVVEAYAMALHPAGGILLVTSADSNGARLHTVMVDAGTGALAPLGSMALGAAGPTSLVFSEDGSLLYVGHRPSQSLRTYRVGAQGALTLIDTDTPGGSITAIATGATPN